ncbi:MAG: diguanylate cyclase [Gammaproteobacteria bacterium]
MDTTTLILAILVPAAVGYAVMAYVLFRRSDRDVRSLSLVVFFSLLSVWITGSALETLFPTVAVHSVARVLIFAGAGFTPIAIVAFLSGYTVQGIRSTVLAGFCIIPTLTVLLTATNPWHGLMWDYPPPVTDGRTLPLPDWGPWFTLVHGPYSYGLVLFAFTVFGLHLPSVPPSQRMPAVGMIVAGVLPLLVSGASVLGFGPRDLPVTTLTLAAFIPVYAWMMLGLKVARLSFVAYRGVFEQLRDPVLLLDTEDRVVGANLAAEKLLECRESELVARRLSGESEVVTAIRQCLESGIMQQLSTDSGRHYELRRSSIRTARRRRGGYIVVCRDVTERHRAQDKLARSERLLRTLVDNSSNGILRLRHRADGDRFRCIFANRAAERYLGLPSRRLVGQEIHSFDLPGDGALQALVVRSATEGARCADEMEVGEGARSRWMRVIVEPVDEDVAVTFIDITERKERERQMESYALSDALTGLFNRRGFEQHARPLLARDAESGTGAVIFLDINGFKAINDQHGHRLGDALLQSFADRLRANLRPQDVVGRWGGDEFVVLAPGIGRPEAEQLARRLVLALAERYDIRNVPVACPASVGLALYPEHGRQLNELLRAADHAMYRAKQRSRQSGRLSDSQLLEQVREAHPQAV